MRNEEQPENVPPADPLAEQIDKRTTFDKLVDRLDHEGIVPKTSHPRSALEAILNEEGREYNDSTIASLENIIHPVLDTPPQPREIGSRPAEGEPPHTPRRHQTDDFEQEELALASLSKQLRSTQSTIKDANRGLRRISNKIEGADAAPHVETIPPKGEERPANVKIEPPVEPAPKAELVRKTETASKSINARKTEAGRELKSVPRPEAPQAATTAQTGGAIRPETSSDIRISRRLDHNGKTVCSHCGGRYSSVWRALWVEFRENFYTYDPENRFYISPTWLGWITGMFLVWLMIESSLCLGFCDDVEGPLMPFVTHYVVLLPFRSYLRPYWRFLGWIINTIFNLDNGQVHFTYGQSVPAHTYTAAAATAQATKRAFKSAMEAVDDMGSIWDDEFV